MQSRAATGRRDELDQRAQKDQRRRDTRATGIEATFPTCPLDAAIPEFVPDAGTVRAERHDTYDSHSDGRRPAPGQLPDLAIDGDDGHMPVSAGETRSGHIKEEVAMRYSSGKSNGADGCSVWSRSYQNASNRALHLPMRANQGLVPASASLRASKDVSPFCSPVLHPMDRAAGGVSRVRRVVMRAQLLGGSLLKNIAFRRGSGFVVRIPRLRAPAANPSERSHRAGHSPCRHGAADACIRLAIERLGCVALGTTTLVKLRQQGDSAEG